jgi:hypothetical protein
MLMGRTAPASGLDAIARQVGLDRLVRIAAKDRAGRDLSAAERALFDGVGPLGREALTLEAIRLWSLAPDECGPEVPASPARGAYQLLRPETMVPEGGEAGAYRAAPATHQGRAVIRTLDVWDRIDVADRRARRPRSLTPAQVEAGRVYGALIERMSAAGLAGSSMEIVSGGGAGGVSEGRLADAERVRRMRRRVGDGLALELRRVRPSARGGTRASIRALDVLDMVAVGGVMPSGVLARFGWSDKGDHRKRVVAALRAALDAIYAM